METITFYSYKGGTGRTLAVANAARHLARFGQKVVALDFDLEAPGLHYKFGLRCAKGDEGEIRQGLVEYIHAFYMHAYYGQGTPPERIADYAVPVPAPPGEEPRIHLIPAGCAPGPDYWRKLSQINWHRLLYEKPLPLGPGFFLEMKGRIQEELNPDFLLIDSRTGITEIGGVALVMLPERVVCVLLSNEENLVGSRAVLRSLRGSLRPPGAPPVEVVAVLSRIPPFEHGEEDEAEEGEGEEGEGSDRNGEARLLEEVRSFLNEPADELVDTLNVQEVFVLHSQPDLQVRERLLVGAGVASEGSPLLADYLRLFHWTDPASPVSPSPA